MMFNTEKERHENVVDFKNTCSICRCKETGKKEPGDSVVIVSDFERDIKQRAKEKFDSRKARTGSQRQINVPITFIEKVHLETSKVITRNIKSIFTRKS